MPEIQQKNFTQPPRYGVTYPEGEQARVALFSRASLTCACRGNERMASVLEYFIYTGSWEMEWQKLPEGCKVVTFTRKHADILKRLTFQLSRKSLIGFLDIFNEWKLIRSEKYHNHYTVDFEAVQAAIDHPPAPKERKPRTRKGCKVEAITTEDNTSTLLQKVEELQQKVELLQPYVEEVQRLGCTCSTLQRGLTALVETLQAHFPEVPIITYYPLLSSSTEGTFASAHVPHASSDFLPEETHEHDAQASRPAAAHDPLPGSSVDTHAFVGAAPDVEEDTPTAHRLPAIKIGATHGNNPDSGSGHANRLPGVPAVELPDTRPDVTGPAQAVPAQVAIGVDNVTSIRSLSYPGGDSDDHRSNRLPDHRDSRPENVAIASIPGEPDIYPLSEQTRQSQTTSPARVTSTAPTAMRETHEQPDGAATGSSSEPRPSGKQLPLSLQEDEPHIKPETPRERERRIEQRQREIWALVEEKLQTKYSKTQRQTKANTAGMENLIEDDTDDQTIKDALDKLSNFWRMQFDLLKFHALIPGLLAAQVPPPVKDGKIAPQEVPVERWSMAKHKKMLKEMEANQQNLQA